MDGDGNGPGSFPPWQVLYLIRNLMYKHIFSDIAIIATTKIKCYYNWIFFKNHFGVKKSPGGKFHEMKPKKILDTYCTTKITIFL